MYIKWHHICKYINKYIFSRIIFLKRKTQKGIFRNMEKQYRFLMVKNNFIFKVTMLSYVFKNYISGKNKEIQNIIMIIFLRILGFQ